MDSVEELATRNAANLAEKLAEVNGEKKLTPHLPTLARVGDWIKRAKTLPVVIGH